MAPVGAAPHKRGLILIAPHKRPAVAPPQSAGEQMRLTLWVTLLVFLIWQVVNHLTMMQLPMPLYHALCLVVEATVVVVAALVLVRVLEWRRDLVRRMERIARVSGAA